MRTLTWAQAASVCLLLTGCSSQPKPSTAPEAGAPPRITQFYATAPKLPRGEKELLCYGVENAKTVWLSPPRQELSAALSRCVEVTPKENTTYTLTVEGASGKTATQNVDVVMGGPRVHIVDVTVSSLTAKSGDQVSLCYRVQNARSVAIDPISFKGGSETHGCTFVQPKATTTYTVIATGVDGDEDRQPVTITIK
jgi:hypothetical protein